MPGFNWATSSSRMELLMLRSEGAVVLQEMDSNPTNEIDTNSEEIFLNFILLSLPSEIINAAQAGFSPFQVLPYPFWLTTALFRREWRKPETFPPPALNSCQVTAVERSRQPFHFIISSFIQQSRQRGQVLSLASFLFAVSIQRKNRLPRRSQGSLPSNSYPLTRSDESDFHSLLPPSSTSRSQMSHSFLREGT